MFFALTLRNLSHESKAPFTVYYLDDATIGGNAESISVQLERVRHLAESVGLRLKEKKCELVSSDSDFVERLKEQLPGCTVSDPQNAMLLGAPFGTIAANRL